MSTAPGELPAWKVGLISRLLPLLHGSHAENTAVLDLFLDAFSFGHYEGVADAQEICRRCADVPKAAHVASVLQQAMANLNKLNLIAVAGRDVA